LLPELEFRLGGIFFNGGDAEEADELGIGVGSELSAVVKASAFHLML
jgi:hypothetical protein